MLQDENAESRRRLELFKPAFSQLVALIAGRVRYPDDWDTWHRDDQDEFRQQRYSVADTLQDAAGECCLLLPSPAWNACLDGIGCCVVRCLRC